MNELMPTLGDLANPSNYTKPLDVTGESHEELLRWFRQMVTIRLVEEKIALEIERKNVVCPCHLSIGQEAIAVGVSAHLRKDDRVFGGHRSHAHYLAKGGTVFGLFAEVLGKDAGCSKGMGGSMHLFDATHGFMGSVPIVAGTIPLAVGAALACHKDRSSLCSLCYFGDGASEEGVFHESLNFASQFRLPCLFVCENNFFSSHLHIDLRQPERAISRFAQAHAIPFDIVDGNDIAQISRRSAQLLSHVRQQRGPAFLEAVTYRWRGHVGHREDIDVGVSRQSNLSQWKKRDPIRRLADALIGHNVISKANADQLENEIRGQIEYEWNRAVESDYPNESQTLSRVYATPVSE